MGRIETNGVPSFARADTGFSPAAQAILNAGLSQRRQERPFDGFATRPLDVPPFGVVAAVGLTTGYSPENRRRINADPTAMIDILSEEGSLCERIPTGGKKSDPDLMFAVSGSPYTDPRDPTTEHFMAFFHNHDDPQFYTLENLAPEQIGALVNVAHTYINRGPGRRMAGINIGTQGEVGVGSSQGWKNLHLQCFSIPSASNRRVVSAMDPKEREYVDLKIPPYRQRQEKLRDILVGETQAFFGDGGVAHALAEHPDMFDIMLPENISLEYIGTYIKLLHEYMAEIHNHHRSRAFSDLHAPWPTSPLMTVGFAKQHGTHAMRIAINSAPGGTPRGVAESLNVWPRRPNNNGIQADTITENEMATPAQWDAFVNRTKAAARVMCVALTHQMPHDTRPAHS